MVFCISVGFSNSAAQPSPWACWICDTVILPLNGDACQVLTGECSKKVEDVMYECNDAPSAGDTAPPSPPQAVAVKPSAPPTALSTVPGNASRTTPLPNA